jgi:trans-aconitate methyltransferase
VELLDVKPGERIHDVGCGTGYLTQQIKNLGADVVGTDYSPEMIAQAQKLYPEVTFAVADAGNHQFIEPFDAVFSNAALHWVKNQDGMMQSVYNSLKPGGRFVAEMGGKGNMGKIIAATKTVLTAHGYTKLAEKQQWYFPSLSEYTTKLEAQGFRVTFAAHFDRDTLLQDGRQGVAKWLNMFGPIYFEGIAQAEKEQILNEITDILEPDYNKNGNWYADYKRLRFIAIKEL